MDTQVPCYIYLMELHPKLGYGHPEQRDEHPHGPLQFLLN